MFPLSPVIHSSVDYDQFKKIEWNRSLNASNIRKLLKENQKKFQLHKFPIIVTDDFKIIDGQHRFEVAKKLNSPVYFIIDGNDYSFEVVHSVNKAGKIHTLKDKIEMLYMGGDEGAKTIYNVYDIFGKKFDVALVSYLLVDGYSSGNVNGSIDKNGSLVINNLDEGTEILYCCTKLNIEDKYSQRVVLSFNTLCRKSEKKPIEIVNQINKNIFLWNNPRTKDKALEALCSCYNYRLQNENKIRLF
jgi:hypothetical protein